MNRTLKTVALLSSICILFACAEESKETAEKEGTERIVSHYPSGRKEAEGSFVNGAMEGKWVTWFENGDMETEENYVNGLLDKRRVKWHENGQVREYGFYKDGNLHGRMTRWSPDGTITFDARYENGKEVEVFVKPDNGK